MAGFRRQTKVDSTVRSLVGVIFFGLFLTLSGLVFSGCVSEFLEAGSAALDLPAPDDRETIVDRAREQARIDQREEELRRQAEQLERDRRKPRPSEN